MIVVRSEDSCGETYGRPRHTRDTASPTRSWLISWGLVGTSVGVTSELEAEIPSSAPDIIFRTVTENSRTLKFSNHGLEKV